MTRRLVLSYVGLALLILVMLEIPFGILAQRHERDMAASQAEQQATGLAAVASEDVRARPPFGPGSPGSPLPGADRRRSGRRRSRRPGRRLIHHRL